jgi:hypothetical protein
MKYVYLIAAIAMLGTACRHKNSRDVPAPEIIRIDSADYVTIAHIDSFVNSITFIPIATSEVNVIGELGKVAQLNDKLVVLDQLDKGMIKILDTKGSVVGKVDNVRASKMSDFAIKDGHIEVYYKLLKMIDVFDETGKLLKSEKLSRHLLAERFATMPDDTYLFWSGTTLNHDGLHRVLAYNSYKEYHNGFLDIDPAISDNVNVYNSVPFHVGEENEVLVTHPLCDTVFGIQYGGGNMFCYPKYTFSFSKHPLPPNYINNPGIPKYLSHASKSDYSFFGGKYLEFDSLILASNVADMGFTYYCVWDKHSKKVKTNAYMLRAKELDIDLPMYNVRQVSGQTAIGFYPAYQLLEWAEKHPSPQNEAQKQLLAVSSKLQKLDNPVLVQIDFK